MPAGVKPWFAGKLDFSPPVTEFAAAGYPLVGGRLDYLQGRAVAALVYQRRKHVINVFVWPDAREASVTAATRQGYHVIQAKHAGMAYCVVSDLNQDELAAFARLLVSEPRSRRVQESDHGLVHLGGALEIRKVPAFRDHDQPGAGNRAGDVLGALAWDEVVVSMDHQGWNMESFEPGKEAVLAG